MSTFFLPFVLGLPLLTFSAVPPGHSLPATRPAVATRRYALLPDRSTLRWEGRALAHGHNGTLRFREGELHVQGTRVIGGRVTVDMTTLQVTDIKDPVVNLDFLNHLRGDDFFAVPQYPQATFVVTRVESRRADKAAAPNATVWGQLTLKGQTQPLSFPARVSVQAGQATVRGTARVDRTRYGIRYNSSSFFQALGDGAIDDEFTLDFVLVSQPSLQSDTQATN